MVASGRFMNWSAVAFTPSSTSTAIPITEVTDVEIDPRLTFRGASGDGDIIPSAKTLEYMDPKVTITTEDLKAMNTIGFGVKGTLVATMNDFYNGEGTGAWTITIANCIAGAGKRGGKHRNPGSGTMEFETFSPDGRTSPISHAYAA